jgi:hypothetical protein
LKAQEITKMAKEIIDAYRAAGLPQVTFDDAADYARIIFNAEEIPAESNNLVEDSGHIKEG